eukprot:6204737-Pleurochrysis_carterae.AAC.4
MSFAHARPSRLVRALKLSTLSARPPLCLRRSCRPRVPGETSRTLRSPDRGAAATCLVGAEKAVTCTVVSISSLNLHACNFRRLRLLPSSRLSFAAASRLDASGFSAWRRAWCVRSWQSLSSMASAGTLPRLGPNALHGTRWPYDRKLS